MKKIKVLFATILLLCLGLGMSSGVFALITYQGGGVMDYGQDWSWGQVRQYSNYHHAGLSHRSSVYQNGGYYYSYPRDFYADGRWWAYPGKWAIAEGPWSWGLYSYNSYWATR